MLIDPEQSEIVLIDPKQGVDYFKAPTGCHVDGGVVVFRSPGSAAAAAEGAWTAGALALKRVSQSAACNAQELGQTPCLSKCRNRLGRFRQWMLARRLQGRRG